MKIVDQIFETLESYAIGLSFVDSNIKLYTKENDYSIYDAWDYDVPACYSMSIFNEKMRFFKLSRNKRSGELILEASGSKLEQRSLLDKIYKEFAENSAVSVRMRSYTNEIDFNFEGYFPSHYDEYLLDVIKQYISI